MSQAQVPPVSPSSSSRPALVGTASASKFSMDDHFAEILSSARQASLSAQRSEATATRLDSQSQQPQTRADQRRGSGDRSDQGTGKATQAARNERSRADEPDQAHRSEDPQGDRYEQTGDDDAVNAAAAANAKKSDVSKNDAVRPEDKDKESADESASEKDTAGEGQSLEAQASDEKPEESTPLTQGEARADETDDQDAPSAEELAALTLAAAQALGTAPDPAHPTPETQQPDSPTAQQPNSPAKAQVTSQQATTDLPHAKGGESGAQDASQNPAKTAAAQEKAAGQSEVKDAKAGGEHKLLADAGQSGKANTPSATPTPGATSDTPKTGEQAAASDAGTRTAGSAKAEAAPETAPKPVLDGPLPERKPGLEHKEEAKAEQKSAPARANPALEAAPKDAGKPQAALTGAPNTATGQETPGKDAADVKANAGSEGADKVKAPGGVAGQDTQQQNTQGRGESDAGLGQDRHEAKEAQAKPQARLSLRSRQEAQVQKIVEAIRIARQGGVRVIRMLLEPPSLGTLRIKITIKDHTVRASLVADSAAARHLLTEHRAALAKALSEGGLSLEGLEVSVGGDQQQPELDSERSSSQDQFVAVPGVSTSVADDDRGEEEEESVLVVEDGGSVNLLA